MLSWVFLSFCFVYRRFAAKCGFSSFFAFFLRNTLVLKRIGAVSPFSRSFPLFPLSFPLLVALCGCFALFSFASHSFCRFPVELSALCAIMRILLFLELFSFVFLCKAVFRRYSFFPLLVSAICNATRVFQVYPRSFPFYGALFLFRPIFAFLSVFSSPSDVLSVLFAVLADTARLSRFYGLSRAILQSLRRLAPFLFIFGVSPQFCAFFRSPAFIRPFHRINPSFTRISTLFLRYDRFFHDLPRFYRAPLFLMRFSAFPAF